MSPRRRRRDRLGRRRSDARDALPRGAHRPRRDRARTSRALARCVGPPRDDGGRQGERLRPRRGRGRARGASTPGPTGSASPTSTRRSRCARAGIDAPVLAWLHGPDDRLRAPPSTPASTSASHASTSSSAPPRPPARAVHLKLDTGLSRNGVEPAERPGRLRRAPPSCAALRGARHLHPPLEHRRAEDDAQLARLRAAAREAPRRRARPRAACTSPRPRRRSPCPSCASTWCASASASTGSPVRRRHRRRGARPAPGDDARRDRRRRAPRPRRRRGQLRLHAPHRRDRRRSRSCRSATRTASPAPPPARAGARSAGRGYPRRRAASRWTSSSSTSATRRSRSATRSSSSATRRPGADAPTSGPRWADTINYEIVTRIGPRVPRGTSATVMRARRSPTPTRWRRSAPGSRRCCAPATSCMLDGELGAGKTTLTRGLGAALGVRGPITSPTFVLAREHPTASGAAARARRRLPAGDRGRARRPRPRLASTRSSSSSGAPASSTTPRRLGSRSTIERPGRRRPARRRLARAHVHDHRASAHRWAELDAARAVGSIACCSPSTPPPARASPSSTRRVRPGRAPTSDTRGHAEAIGTLIAEALAAGRRRAAPITGVVAGMGPGPFTGLRVGIAAARAFALGRGIPVLPVASHDAVALRAREPRRRSVVTDARRREVAWIALRGLDGDGLPVRVAARDLASRRRRLRRVRARRRAAISAGIPRPARRAAARPRPRPVPTQPLYLRSPDVTPSPAPKRVTG